MGGGEASHSLESSIADHYARKAAQRKDIRISSIFRPTTHPSTRRRMSGSWATSQCCPSSRKYAGQRQQVGPIAVIRAYTNLTHNDLASCSRSERTGHNRRDARLVPRELALPQLRDQGAGRPTAHHPHPIRLRLPREDRLVARATQPARGDQVAQHARGRQLPTPGGRKFCPERALCPPCEQD